MRGNVCVAMGRSKLTPLTSDDGELLFGGGYVFEYGRVDRVCEGRDGLVLAMGTPAGAALAVVRALAAEGRDLAFGVVACPLALSNRDADWVAEHDVVVTVEDHGVHTGLGATVAEALADRGAATRLVRHGVDHYMTSGAAADLYRLARLDEVGIREVVVEAVSRVSE
jgi:transketolase